ncbi:hypothetical protein BLNAU_428 [Blattamonas nauphoetae]|uniref:Symplekin n=1 Tax=Blattamonas nauphoetae TaxID=2049346 RepID=A0ABQ9YL95_9EUKA|nr:hypothetical protein BLNAU_428 [Blattamonas nauphoetae]
MERMFHERVTAVRTVLAYPNKGTLVREIKALLVHVQSLSNVFLTLGRDDNLRHILNSFTGVLATYILGPAESGGALEILGDILTNHQIHPSVRATIVKGFLQLAPVSPPQVLDRVAAIFRRGVTGLEKSPLWGQMSLLYAYSHAFTQWESMTRRTDLVAEAQLVNSLFNSSKKESIQKYLPKPAPIPVEPQIIPQDTVVDPRLAAVIPQEQSAIVTTPVRQTAPKLSAFSSRIAQRKAGILTTAEEDEVVDDHQQDQPKHSVVHLVDESMSSWNDSMHIRLLYQFFHRPFEYHVKTEGKHKTIEHPTLSSSDEWLSTLTLVSPLSFTTLEPSQEELNKTTSTMLAKFAASSPLSSTFCRTLLTFVCTDFSSPSDQSQVGTSTENERKKAEVKSEMRRKLVEEWLSFEYANAIKEDIRRGRTPPENKEEAKEDSPEQPPVDLSLFFKHMMTDTHLADELHSNSPRSPPPQHHVNPMLRDDLEEKEELDFGLSNSESSTIQFETSQLPPSLTHLLSLRYYRILSIVLHSWARQLPPLFAETSGQTAFLPPHHTFRQFLLNLQIFPAPAYCILRTLLVGSDASLTPISFTNHSNDKCSCSDDRRGLKLTEQETNQHTEADEWERMVRDEINTTLNTTALPTMPNLRKYAVVLIRYVMTFRSATRFTCLSILLSFSSLTKYALVQLNKIGNTTVVLNPNLACTVIEKAPRDELIELLTTNVLAKPPYASLISTFVLNVLDKTRQLFEQGSGIIPNQIRSYVEPPFHAFVRLCLRHQQNIEPFFALFAKCSPLIRTTLLDSADTKTLAFGLDFRAPSFLSALRHAPHTIPDLIARLTALKMERDPLDTVVIELLLGLLPSEE